jgi:hypothetical protein
VVGRSFCNQFVTDKWYNIQVLGRDLEVSSFWFLVGGRWGERVGSRERGGRVFFMSNLSNGRGTVVVC